MQVRTARDQKLERPDQIYFANEGHTSGCACCERQLPFSVPTALVDEFKSGNVVIFAGAGISTENKNVMPWTLYDDIVAASGGALGVPFADAMSAYARRPNGRIDLVRRIRERVEYIESFPYLYDDASRFHRELATLPMVKTIITTNWDSFFERECLATPFVFPEDLAFWEAADRKVLKIHGTLENLGSLIATREDYDRSLQQLQSGQIGAFLKTICANKTIVFAGYSIRDEDFVATLAAVSSAMGQYRKRYYAVTIDETPEAAERFRSFNITPIITDATFFLSKMKSHLHEHTCLVRDELYPACRELLDDLVEEHLRLYDDWDMRKYPHVIYSACYQDGMMHCLQRIDKMRGSGEYADRHKILAKIAGYDARRAEKLRLGKYEDVAYIDGYLMALLFAVGEDFDQMPPIWYVYGSKLDIFSKSAFRREMKSFVNGRALAHAKKLAQKCPPGTVYEHMCQLV